MLGISKDMQLPRTMSDKASNYLQLTLTHIYIYIYIYIYKNSNLLSPKVQSYGRVILVRITAGGKNTGIYKITLLHTGLK